jgi:hypothetical protein
MKRNALRFRPALSSTLKYAPNEQAARKCREVMALYHQTFGPMTIPDRMKSIAVRLMAIRESRRLKKEGTVMRQPPTRRITYPDRTLGFVPKSSLVAIAPVVREPELEATPQ